MEGLRGERRKQAKVGRSEWVGAKKNSTLIAVL